MIKKAVFILIFVGLAITAAWLKWSSIEDNRDPDMTYGQSIGYHTDADPLEVLIGRDVSIPFVENRGQLDSEKVRFYAQTFGGTAFIENGGVVTYNLPAAGGKGVAIREFLSDREARPKGIEPSPVKVSCFIGNNRQNWRSNLPTYKAVSFGEIFDGISLTLKAYGNNVEKIFKVSPGVDPASIKIRVEGAEGLQITEKGELELQTSVGMVLFTKPFAYQEDYAGEREEIEVTYKIYNAQTYGFSVGVYDPIRPLYIDPLLASTFIGGSYRDYLYALALDASENVYIAVYTESNDYPITSGAYENPGGGWWDISVSKLSYDLTALLASTLIGGSGDDGVHALALDSLGNVYVAGYTESDDYPITPGALDTSHNGASDVFVSKLDSDLSTLLASTFIGGSSYDKAYGLAIGLSGNVYVAGYTYTSTWPGIIDYPTTSGAYDESGNGIEDVFVSKLDSSLSTLLASTFIGGGDRDIAYTLALDSSGNVYVAGKTYSSDYPTTSGAYDTSYNYYEDGFVSKLNNNLSELLASTFLGGGRGEDYPQALALDSSGNIFVAGCTSSSDFPITDGAYDTSYNGSDGNRDAFVSKLSADLRTLLASTFLAGESNSEDYAWALAVDPIDNVYVAGETDSGWYPTTPGAYDTSFNGSVDAFISKLNSDLTELLASTFIGGSAGEVIRALVLDSLGNVYVAGTTSSTDYPTTLGAYDTSFNGDDPLHKADVFVSKLDSDLIADYDGDSVPDIEEQGPAGDDPSYDGNSDGVPDRQQNWVASLHTYDRSSYVTLAAPAPTTVEGKEIYVAFTRVRAVDNPHPSDVPEGVEFPWGFFDFTLELHPVIVGVHISLYLPEGSSPTTYWKYGPTPDDPIDHWYEFTHDGVTGLRSIRDNVITLKFFDSIDPLKHRGDHDSRARYITDPGGPAIIPDDVDGEGVSDAEEQGPAGDDPSYDGNSDGIPDREQRDVASLHTYDRSAYVTLACSGGTFQDVQAQDNPHPSDSPEGVEFPWGFFSFTIELDPGVTEATITIYLPAGSSPTTYWKYGLTPDNAADHWYEFLYDGQTGAEFDGNTIILHLVDGQRGDHDLAVNGVIHDPGGPGLPSILLGDVSLNGEITAYDASLILRYLVGKGNLNERQIAAADVTGNGEVTAYDAAKILQFVVGIINSFSSEQGAPPMRIASRTISIPSLKASSGQRITLPITVDDPKGIISGQMKVRFDAKSLRFITARADLHLESSLKGDVLKLAFAGEREIGDKSLIYLEFEVMDGLWEVARLELEDAKLNEEIQVQVRGGGVELIPDRSELLPNYPNPFNPDTWIPFRLAEGADVLIRIYDVRGRLVRIIELGHMEAGNYISRSRAAYWDGRNDLGERVASGVYIYQMQIGKKIFARRMVVLK